MGTKRSGRDKKGSTKSNIRLKRRLTKKRTTVHHLFPGTPILSNNEIEIDSPNECNSKGSGGE